ILSLGMLFRYGLHLEAEADAVDAAVSEVLRRGLRTGDIKAPGETAIGCRAMGDAVVECLQTPQG
ncbi:MAG: isocitrate/isopropylmalate family dehydrogenase, partial [Thermodesulfobacteriota bacterium]